MGQWAWVMLQAFRAAGRYACQRIQSCASNYRNFAKHVGCGLKLLEEAFEDNLCGRMEV